MTSYRRNTAWLLAGALLLALEACGFGLRGGDTEAMAEPGLVYIDSPPRYQELVLLLEQTFTADNQTLVGHARQADRIVHIEDENIERRVLALTDTGQPAEYQLRYSLTYRITDAEGRALVNPQNIVLLRDYGFDPSRLLSQSAEEAALLDEMRQETADIIAQRLRTLPQQPGTNAP